MKQSKKKKTKKTSAWNVRCRSDDVRVVASLRFQDVVALVCLDVNLSCSEGDLMNFFNIVIWAGKPSLAPSRSSYAYSAFGCAAVSAYFHIQ